MAEEEINYVKEVLGSQWNLAFIGLMVFLMFVSNFWGFLALLGAGEIAATLLAQMQLVQRAIQVSKYKDKKEASAEAETSIVAAMPDAYQRDYQAMRNLCDEIERRSSELGASGTSSSLLNSIVEKLGSFRFEYARMLRAHHLLSTRNYRHIQTALATEIGRAEQAVEAEQSAQVRSALRQNLNILRQRLERIRKLEELVRLLEARLQIVRNSLSLIQDEVYTFTDVAGISGLVDNLLTNLSVSEEFRADYEDVLSAETEAAAISAIEARQTNSSSSASRTADEQATKDEARRQSQARAASGRRQGGGLK